MLLNLVALTTLSALATAFRIPEDTPDGVYTAYYNTTGHQILELISPIPAASSSSASQFSRGIKQGVTELVRFPHTKRGQSWCGCTFGMDHGDCDAANEALKAQFSPGYNLAARTGTFAVRGSAAAFACNYGNYNVQIFSGTVITGAQHVTSSCGWYIAGTWRVDGFDALDYGYMNWVNQNVCDAAESSGSHKC
ncbi:hypothetical protein B0H63DRAFT_519953 [Podospora didyma]|uniref:Ecp2 effector protein domain-containing protein n=1 Tax=Podospora didyma TaxID=330526 RepID=A0AAE0P008_9PEZI|nr:hypothetical protein B0H63DRAFT_519953 [Podospora didyma]